MANLPSWLGLLVESELRQALAWQSKSLSKPDPGIKLEPVDGSRFSDDGSNLRIHLTTQHLPNAQVQLIEVITAENPVQCVLSDGSTSIMARLSKEARSALESNLDDTLSKTTKGDVFAITEMRLVATPYGPQNGFLSLLVKGIEYHHHLRKTLDRSSPVEEYAGIRELVQFMTKLRKTEETPMGIKGPNSSSFAPTAATRRRQVPTLSRDGFEQLNGVNLERPQGPMGRVPTYYTGDSGDRSPVNIMNNSTSNNSIKTNSEMSKAQRFSRPTIATYGRKKVPVDQQKLLSRPESWLPSSTFPHPNLPVNLLDKMNVANRSKSIPHTFPVADRESSSSGSSSASDHELPASQWPASQESPQRNALPPDSSGLSPAVPRALPSNDVLRSRNRQVQEPHALAAYQPIDTNRVAKREFMQKQKLAASYIADATCVVNEVAVWNVIRTIFPNDMPMPKNFTKLVIDTFSSIAVERDDTGQTIIAGIKLREVNPAIAGATMEDVEMSDSQTNDEMEPSYDVAVEEDRRTGIRDHVATSPTQQGGCASSPSVEPILERVATPPSIAPVGQPTLEHKPIPSTRLGHMAPKEHARGEATDPAGSGDTGIITKNISNAISQQKGIKLEDAVAGTKARESVEAASTHKGNEHDSTACLLEQAGNEAKRAEKPLTAFEEFRRAWMSVRPSNAFGSTRMQAGRREETAARAINVLAWDL